MGGAIQNSFKLRGAPSPQFASASNYGPLSAPFNAGGQAPRRRQRPSISVRKRPVLNSTGAPNLQTLNDYDDYYGGVPAIEDIISEDEVLEERDPAFLDCKISLFSKTYLRGENFSLDITNTDMPIR